MSRAIYVQLPIGLSANRARCVRAVAADDPGMAKVRQVGTEN
jgi:hypothetical protein